MAFWGLVVHPGKSYTQTVDAPFHISMACLGEKPSSGRHTLILTEGESGDDFVLCNLSTDKVEQQQLDLTFAEGEEITIKMAGNSPIHLTGSYILDEPVPYGDFDDDDDDESIDSADMLDDDDDEEEEDSDADIEAIPAGKLQEITEDGEDEDDDEMEEEPVKPAPKSAQKQNEVKRKAEAQTPQPEAKKAKTDAGAASQKATPAPKAEAAKPTPAAKATPAQQAKATPATDKKSQDVKTASKAEGKQQKQQQGTPSPADGDKTPKKKTLPSGLTIEDKVVGSGAKAKKGKSLAVRYIGKLANGKVFDSNTSGAPFKMQLGKGSVIKGWEVGLEGMTAGGTRVLTIPPNLAYGAKGAPPDIPPNSTLTFEIKLLSVD